MQLDRPVVLDHEDDVAMVEILRALLEPAGYLVKIASTGASGLSHWAADDVDLVLLDLLPPDLDGLDLCQWVRARDDAVYLPIIVLTAHAEQRHAAFAAGADDYVAPAEAAF
jgi:two-component system, OmpR family, phosphate regulon response regulator OmpR